MKASGKMINPMELESISILMELYMKDRGRMINNMERGLRFGPMAKNTKDNIIWVLKKVKEFLNLTTPHFIKVTSLITKFMEKVFILLTFRNLYLVLKQEIHWRLEE